jgi:hypothetical protein
MSQEFKRTIRKKSSKWFLISFIIIPAYAVVNSLINTINGNDTWSKFAAMTSACVMYLIFLLQFIRNMDKKLKIANSYKLTLNDGSIVKEMDTYPVKSILTKDIVSVIKENDGSIRINGDDGIWIPSDIENIKHLEKLLESYSSINYPNKLEITKEKPFETFDNFLEALQQKFGAVSLFTVIIILCSYIKLLLFYNQFNIIIYNYLDASEIIFSFTTLFKEFVILIVAFLIIHKSFIFIKLKLNENKINNLVGFISLAISVGALTYMYISIPEMLSLDKEGIDLLVQQFALIFYSYGVACGLSFFLYMATFYIKQRERLITLPLTSLAVFFTFFLITSTENRISHDLLMHGHPKFKINVYLTDQEIIESSDSLIFIGATNNYLFFRDKPNESNLIIPRSSILKEEQKQLRNGL